MKRKWVARWTGLLGLVLLVVSAASGAESVIPQLLPEGTTLKSVDGVIVRADCNDVWLFEVTRDVNEADVQLPAGTRLELLPSVTLGDLLFDANDRVTPRYRLTGQVTLYRQTNFLLASYYLPLSKLKDPNAPGGPESVPDPLGAISRAARDVRPDDMAIPPEIRERLRERRAVRGPQRRSPDTTDRATDPNRVPNRVLVDAVGFIERRQDRLEFVPDALGRNVSVLRYELLPCRALEQAERRMAAWPERIRFNVAGLVTAHKGNTYLLLQRVMRVYNHGNFGG